MDLGLKNRVALITGASRGLGRASAESLLREGVSVLAVARPSAELDALGSAFGEQCRVFSGDLKDPTLPAAAVTAAVEAFGRLDILVVNTPGPRPVQPLDVTEADFKDAFEASFYPALRLMQAAIPEMRAKEWGRIAIISSTSVKAPKPFLCLSAAARSALWAWAKSAAPALFEHGITVNALFAGPHATDRAKELGFKGRAIGQPEDFGDIVATMCGQATRFVTGTGAILDGGELTGI